MYVYYTSIGKKKRVNEHAVTIVLAWLIFLRHTRADLIPIQTSDINFKVRDMQMIFILETVVLFTSLHKNYNLQG